MRVVSNDVSDDVSVVVGKLPVDGRRRWSGGHVTSQADVTLAQLDVQSLAVDVWTICTTPSHRRTVNSHTYTHGHWRRQRIEIGGGKA